MVGEDASEDTGARDREVLRLREGGASWLAIQQQFGLTRQQARYAYQKAKREERRAERRGM
jgi:CRISPR/Cas system CSM-associated protein Csm2 small subunit